MTAVTGCMQARALGAKLCHMSDAHVNVCASYTHACASYTHTCSSSTHACASCTRLEYKRTHAHTIGMPSSAPACLPTQPALLHPHKRVCTRVYTRTCTAHNSHTTLKACPLPRSLVHPRSLLSRTLSTAAAAHIADSWACDRSSEQRRPPPPPQQQQLQPGWTPSGPSFAMEGHLRREEEAGGPGGGPGRGLPPGSTEGRAGEVLCRTPVCLCFPCILWVRSAFARVRIPASQVHSAVLWLAHTQARPQVYSSAP